MWLIPTNYVGFAFNVLINLAVMRILAPAEVGAYALAFAVCEFISLIGAFSLDLAVVHFSAEEHDETLLDTAYILSLVLGLATIAVGVALFFALAAFAPFTREVRLFIVLLVLPKPLYLLSSITVALLERQFRYVAVSLSSLAVTSLPNLACLALAAAGGGASALVARDVGTAILAYVVFGLVSRWRCGWKFSWSAASKLLRYSNMMFLARVLEVVIQRFDRLLVGTIIGKGELGSYHNGRYLAEIGLTLSVPIGRISFNVYSRLKDDLHRLQVAYRLVSFFLVRGGALLAVALLFLARDVVIVLYGPKWLSVVPTARLLAPYAACLPILSNLLLLLYGRGLMRGSVLVRVVQVAIFVPGIVVATASGSSWATEATACVLVATTLVGIFHAVRLQREIAVPVWKEVVLGPSVAAAVASVAAILATIAMQDDGFGHALVRLCAVTVSYLLALVAIEWRDIIAYYRYLRSMLRQEGG